MPPRSSKRLVALLVLFCVLWTAAACYRAVQQIRSSYLGEGLRRK